MGSFLILECEKCGAHLEFADKRDVYYCEHCGAKHLHEKITSGSTDESYAACPLCGRNDKAKKLSSFGNLYKPAELSKVPEKFAKPYSKKNPFRSLIGIISGIVFFVVLALPSRDWIFIVLGAVWILFSLSYYFFVVKLGNDALTKKNEIAKEKWKSKKERYNRYMLKLPKMIEIWDVLYYCERDDIVYELDSNNYTTKDNLKDFIEKKALDEK